MGLYRETLPEGEVPTELPRSVRWQDAIFPPQIEKELIIVFIARICEKKIPKRNQIITRYQQEGVEDLRKMTSLYIGFVAVV